MRGGEGKEKESRGEKGKGEEVGGTQMNIANSLNGQIFT